MKYKKDFDDFQNKYTKKYPTANTMRNILLDTLMIRGKRLLDVGCGSGIDLEFFSKEKAKVYGIDISKELVNIAKQRLLESEIVEGSFNYLSWKNNFFDIVWSKYALQHDKDISISLNEIYRVLKKDGKVFLQITHPMRSSEFLRDKNYFKDGEIINYPTIDGKIINEYHHTLSEWIKTLLNIGFEIINFEEILNRPLDEYKGKVSPSAIIFVLKKK